MIDVNMTLVLISAGLIGCGVYLLLERSLSRVLVGLVMMGNGVAIGFLVSAGPAGEAPIMVDGVNADDISDPLPQAMVLTAIVIMLATTAFVLAMAYRSWQLNGHDDVQDDPEDALIRRLAEHDSQSEAYENEDIVGVEEDSDFAEGELGEAPTDAATEAITPGDEQGTDPTDEPAAEPGNPVPDKPAPEDRSTDNDGEVNR